MKQIHSSSSITKVRSAIIHGENLAKESLDWPWDLNIWDKLFKMWNRPENIVCVKCLDTYIIKSKQELETSEIIVCTEVVFMIFYFVTRERGIGPNLCLC